MGKVKLRIDYWRMPDVAGFAMHWTWIWCVFWTSLFYGVQPGNVGGTAVLGGLADALLLEPLWVSSLASNVLTIGTLLLLSRFRNPLFDFRPLPWLAAGITSVGTLLLSRVVTGAIPQFAAGLYSLGSVLTGVGSGIVVVLWGELFAGMGSKQTIDYSVIALLMAAVLWALISLMPIDTAQLVVVFLPVAGILFFLHFRQGLPRVPRNACNQLVKARPPWRMIVIAVFFGLSFGVMKGLMTPMNSEWLGVRDALNVVGIVAGVLVLHVTTSVFKMDFNHLTYQVALPLMAAGFLFLPLHEPLSIVGTAVHQCGYQYFYIVLWSTWALLAMRGKMPAGWVAAWGLFAIQAGQFAGSIAASMLVADVLVDDLGRAMFSACAVFAMLLVAIFVFGGQAGEAETSWGLVKPVEVVSSHSELDDAATRLARRFCLSPREIDVFFLLAKGRNRAYVANELAIGDETVKSHIKSLYRKMDLHSQQDLIDLVEAERANAM